MGWGRVARVEVCVDPNGPAGMVAWCHDGWAAWWRTPLPLLWWVWRLAHPAAASASRTAPAPPCPTPPLLPPRRWTMPCLWTSPPSCAKWRILTSEPNGWRSCELGCTPVIWVAHPPGAWAASTPIS